MTKTMELTSIREQAAEAARLLIQAAAPKGGELCVIGCSTSEVVGERIGSASNADVAKAIMAGLLPVLREAGVYVAVQGCEHINRSLCVERDCMERYHLAEVWVEPWLHAGGAFCTEAAERFTDHVMVEDLRGQATLGIDIGGTLIGMHMRPVVVPVHAALRQIGSAVLILAKSRPRYVGGPRAHYPSQAAPR